METGKKHVALKMPLFAFICFPYAFFRDASDGKIRERFCLPGFPPQSSQGIPTRDAICKRAIGRSCYIGIFGSGYPWLTITRRNLEELEIQLEIHEEFLSSCMAVKNLYTIFLFLIQ
jgi:hypothetical protein